MSVFKTLPKNECIIPHLNMNCSFAHNCHACIIADRYRENKRDRFAERHQLFDYYNVLPKTPKGGGSDYTYKPLLLKPEAMERAGIRVDLLGQIFIATDGAGMFPHNPGSQIDGYLVYDRRKVYTFGRQDFYGIPNDKARARYKELFLIDLERFM